MLRNILITNNNITLLAVTITFTSKQNHLKTKISYEANLIFSKTFEKLHQMSFHKTSKILSKILQKAK